MDTIKKYIKEHPFFQDFQAEQLDKIVEFASHMSFDPDQYVFRDGEEANAFFLIMKGIISLEVHAPNRGPVSIEWISAGDVMGWSWLYPPHRWHFDARAKEETHVIILNGKKLREMIEEDHEFGYYMLRKIARVVEDRLQATRVKMMQVYDIYKDVGKTRSKWNES
ncbi:MAG: cyclic nucleotide-binding domain-containing protein [Calditrichaeota bacterium]|nr:cyclic nucleotide-binding domain-containing protein [Calditrichota bacterium]MCB9088370.1 cyclic nucleotide-binding domain-containing protein [Calditrichia bacterium]MCB0289080.1 cyclic nucleotide-binding domain-containing protein [Calditrichota bacterium]MCB0295481.1 cyclic nucleotide-binding domain-containing protein [Calditrichota bacterium]MCB0305321.1 cyclic nucleotide-binding domain-containing protein [Calditrichota bacterium]